MARPPFPPPRPRPKSRLAKIRNLVLTFLAGLFALSILEVIAVRYFDPPTTITMIQRRLEAYQNNRPTRIQRVPVTLSGVSKEMQLAVLVGEDALFYQHAGFDLEQIRNAWEANKKGKALRGASTLTQQVARNVFLWQQRSWIRKGFEAYYTVLLELLVPKDRILELYFNVAEWGDMCFGIEAAARRYYGKSAAQLDRQEAASLSASLPNPRRFPPLRPSKFHERRKKLILKRMNVPLETLTGRVSSAEDDDEN